MIARICAYCSAPFEAQRPARKFCSGRCRTAAFRLKRAEASSAAAPLRAQLLARLERHAPQSAAVAREIIQSADVDCTEQLIRFAGAVVREICPQASKGGAPMK